MPPQVFGLDGGGGLDGDDDDHVPFDLDDDGDLEVAVAGPPTDLAAIEAELSEEVSSPDLKLKVPNRPGYEIVFSTEFPIEKWHQAKKMARTKTAGQKAQVNEVRAACFVLQDLCTGLLRNGEPVVVEGKAVTFASRAFLGMTKKPTVAAAIRHFYGQDGHVLDAGDRVLDAAGYGEVDVDDDNPRPDPR